MKTIIATTIVLLGFVSQSWAGVGTGKVVDVDVRIADTLISYNMFLVKVENHNSAPACTSPWHHTFGKKYDGTVTSALHATLLSAQASGKTVRITGTGSCLPGTGAEEIMDLNIGPWGQ